MSTTATINYLEFGAHDLDATKQFFQHVFGWEFTDYGPDYTAREKSDFDVGFYRSPLKAATANGSALVVFYTETLELLQMQIESAGGVIVKPIFAFPGGRRFHFTEPSGNELAVWSDKD